MNHNSFYRGKNMSKDNVPTGNLVGEFANSVVATRKEERPVHLVWVLDRLQGAQWREAKDKMENLLILSQQSANGRKLQISVIENGEQSGYRATFENLSTLQTLLKEHEDPDATAVPHEDLDKPPPPRPQSRIAETLKKLASGEEYGHLPLIDGVVLSTNGIDGEHDTNKTLERAATDLGVPLFALLGNKNSEEKYENVVEHPDYDKLAKLIEHDGGAILPDSADITFIDDFIKQDRPNLFLVYHSKRGTGGLWPFLAGAGVGAALCCLTSKGCHDENTAVVPVQDTLTQNVDTVSLRSFNDINGPVMFDQNSAVIHDSFKPRLDELGRYLESNPDAYPSLIIEGWASPEGTEDYNRKLSQKRAETITNYLNDNFEINIPLSPVGQGEVPEGNPEGLYEQYETPYNPTNDRKAKFKPLEGPVQEY